MHGIGDVDGDGFTDALLSAAFSGPRCFTATNVRGLRVARWLGSAAGLTAPRDAGSYERRTIDSAPLVMGVDDFDADGRADWIESLQFVESGGAVETDMRVTLGSALAVRPVRFTCGENSLRPSNAESVGDVNGDFGGEIRCSGWSRGDIGGSAIMTWSDGRFQPVQIPSCAARRATPNVFWDIYYASLTARRVDDDPYTDVIAAATRADGSTENVVWYGGPGGLSSERCGPVP